MIDETQESGDRRWIILCEDGRYATVDADPTPDEIGEAENSLRSSGLAGWLAIMEGSPYGLPTPRLMPVRSLADPRGSWDDVVANFLERRKPDS